MANKPAPKQQPSKPAVKPASQLDAPLQDFLGDTNGTSRRTPAESAQQLPFTRQHYRLLLLGLGILVIGYILLGIEPFQDITAGFSVALHIAPIVIIGGYVWIVYAIMAKRKK
jgi:hypothetical protein